MRSCSSVRVMILLLALLAACQGCSKYEALLQEASARDQVVKDPVLFIGGGTLEDQTATVILFTMEGIDYLGLITTNSDCLYSYAMQIQWKLQSYIGRPSYPITLSDARGWNSFPMVYRQDCIKVNQLEVFKGYDENKQWPPWPSGEAFLKEQLSKAVTSGTSITLLVTDPLTPLCTVLRENRELEKGIKRVIWMGGAINVKGNLDPTTIPPELANPKAEWNAYWDPYAVKWLFENTSFPLVLFPLDVTDQAKLTPEFMDALKAQSTQYRYSNLVYSLYNVVENQPYFEMWNTLTTVYVDRPDIFDDPVPMNLIIETEGYMQGAITQAPGGRAASVILNIRDRSAFYSYVLKQLQRN